jgi:hypothetical protein
VSCAADFGAGPGWRVGSEVLPSWQIVIDVGEWLRAMPWSSITIFSAVTTLSKL